MKLFKTLAVSTLATGILFSGATSFSNDKANAEELSPEVIKELQIKEINAKRAESFDRLDLDYNKKSNEYAYSVKVAIKDLTEKFNQKSLELKTKYNKNMSGYKNAVSKMKSDINKARKMELAKYKSSSTRAKINKSYDALIKNETNKMSKMEDRIKKDYKNDQADLAFAKKQEISKINLSAEHGKAQMKASYDNNVKAINKYYDDLILKLK